MSFSKDSLSRPLTKSSGTCLAIKQREGSRESRELERAPEQREFVKEGGKIEGREGKGGEEG